MYQIPFRLGLRPRPHWGAYSSPQAPSWISVDLLLRELEGTRMGKRGRKGEGRGGKGRDRGVLRPPPNQLPKLRPCMQVFRLPPKTGKKWLSGGVPMGALSDKLA